MVMVRWIHKEFQIEIGMVGDFIKNHIPQLFRSECSGLMQ